MPIYKVRYSGFVYIEADCKEDAADDYCDHWTYKEEEIDGIEEIDEREMMDRIFGERRTDNAGNS